MKVLIACEYSGVSRRAFAVLGHDVWSADFEPAEDGAKNHYQGDCFDLIESQHFDLLISHPPCTYLSVSGLHWNKRGVMVDGRPRHEHTEDALQFVRRLMAAPIKHIAIENPVSCISTRIRKPDQIIQPWQFGEDASKATCLWLKNLPKLTPTKIIEGREVIHNGKTVRRWANQTDSGQNRLPPSDDRWKERSRTYPGIAAAWADQWGGSGLSAWMCGSENRKLQQPAIQDLFGAEFL